MFVCVAHQKYPNEMATHTKPWTCCTAPLDFAAAHVVQGLGEIGVYYNIGMYATIASIPSTRPGFLSKLTYKWARKRALITTATA